MRSNRTIRTIRLAAAGLVGIAALGACAPTPGGENPTTTAAPSTAAPTTTVPTGPVNGAIGGSYKVRYGTEATAGIKVSGDTITVVSGPGLRIEGASCTLPTNTVLAILSGSGNRYTGSHWGFSTTTCASNSRYSSTADLNGDGSVSLSGPTGVHLFTKTANAPAPGPAQLTATYDVTYGTSGQATAHVSGDFVTLSVASPLRIEHATCDLPRGRVLATFRGTGTERTGSHWGFGSSTCFSNSRYSSTVNLNSDQSLTVTGPYGPHLFVRRASVTTSSIVDAVGSYRTRYATDGTVNISRSGTNYTVSVGTGFVIEGGACTVPSGTVIAAFSGTGIEMAGDHWGFGSSTCFSNSRYSSTVNLNSDRSVTIDGPYGPHLLERI